MSLGIYLTIALGITLCVFLYYFHLTTVARERRIKAASISKERKFEVCVIGAGISGINLAIKLKEAGIAYEMYETNEEVGGVWFVNRFPHAGCDVPTKTYQYSFEKSPDWSGNFVYRDEILKYFVDVAKKYDVRDSVKFKHQVISCAFHEKKNKWLITFKNLETGETGDKWFDYVVNATGQLNHPKTPQIKGHEKFKGPSFHTARWDESVDFKGKKVIGVGTGASAIQAFPAIASKVSNLTIIQRTPAYFIPRNAKLYSKFEKSIFKTFPFLNIFRFWMYILTADFFFHLAYHKRRGTFENPEDEFYIFHKFLRWYFLRFMKRQLSPSRTEFEQINTDLSMSKKEMDDAFNEYQAKKDELIKTQTPNYVVSCKKVGIADDWYPMFARKNVDLVIEPLVEIDENSIIVKDSDGKKRHIDCDVIIWATGFKATMFADFIDFKVVKQSGKEISLKKKWSGECRAYRGVSVDEFPNMSIVYGPNTNLGHSSIIFMCECEISYIVNLIQEMLIRDASTVVVKKDVYDKYNDDVQHELKGVVWAGNCTNWYKTESGSNLTNWPSTCVEFQAMMNSPDSHNYEFK